MCVPRHATHSAAPDRRLAEGGARAIALNDGVLVLSARVDHAWTQHVGERVRCAQFARSKTVRQWSIEDTARGPSGRRGTSLHMRTRSDMAWPRLGNFPMAANNQPNRRFSMIEPDTLFGDNLTRLQVQERRVKTGWNLVFTTQTDDESKLGLIDVWMKSDPIRETRSRAR